MKKIVILSILASSIIFAQENIEDIKLKGLEFYKNNNYQLAIDEFIKIKDYNKSSSIDFYLARCYYEIAQYEKALAIFERIQINEPDNKRVKLEIAQTYLMLDSYEIAKINFQELLDDSSIPDVVKSNIEIRLKQIDEKSAKHSFSSTFMFGWGQDDNINNISKEYLKINPDSSDKVKSTFYETALLFNHMYNYDDTLSFRNGVTFYKQDFTKDSTKQLDVISLNTAPIYKDGDISYGLIFGLDNILYGDNHYLNNYSITPKISYLIDSTKIYETSVKILDKKFAQEIDEVNDSWIYEYQNKFITQMEKFGIFDLSFVLGRENPQNRLNRTPYVSKEYGTVSFGNNYMITEQLTINSLFSFNNIYYRDEVSSLVRNYLSLPNEKRVDEVYNFTLNLGYAYSKDLILGGTYNFINQNSNYTPNAYNKNTVKTSVYYNF